MHAQEVELKAHVDARTLADLRALACARAHNLHAIYFDTADHRLRRAGIALRVREADGVWTQTLKIAPQSAPRGGLQRVYEQEDPVGGPAPSIDAISDEPLQARLRSALNGWALQPVFAVRVERTTKELQTKHGAVELALDEGDIEVDGLAYEPIREVEFELKSGTVDAVFDCASDLIGDQPARLFIASKADRGFALAEGGTTRKAAPLPTNVTPVARENSTAAMLDALLRVYAQAVAENLYCTLTIADPEGPHQLQVALRRLLATFGAFKSVMRRKVRKNIVRSARRLGRIVSSLRDAGTLIEGAIRAGADNESLAALEKWREGLRRRVRAQLLQARATGFAIALVRLVELGDWRKTGAKAATRLAAPPPVVLRPALDAVWARMQERGNRLAKLSAVKRHALRNELEEMRYVAEIAAADQSVPFLSRLRRLQARLGLLNDLTTLARFDPPLKSKIARKKFAVLRARVLSKHTNRADKTLRNAAASWRRLVRMEPFWHDGGSPADASRSSAPETNWNSC